MSATYDDNFGFWDIDEPEERAFFEHVQRQSVNTSCERCGQSVRLLPTMSLCARCACALECGAPASLSEYKPSTCALRPKAIVQSERATGKGSSVRPLDELKRRVTEFFETARHSPDPAATRFREGDVDHSNADWLSAEMFNSLPDVVRAAQRAGELKAADALQLTAIIVAAVLGAAEFAKAGGLSAPNQVGSAEFPPTLLLDLLSTRSCN